MTPPRPVHPDEIRAPRGIGINEAGGPNPKAFRRRGFQAVTDREPPTSPPPKPPARLPATAPDGFALPERKRPEWPAWAERFRPR